MCFLKITGVLQYYPQFVSQNTIVSESGGWLLTTQKPINRQAWRKRKFALFWMPAISGEGRLVSRGCSPTWSSLGKSVHRWSEGATYRNSMTSSDSHLEIGHWWSDQHHLMVLSTVNVQFHGWPIPLSLRPIFRLVAAYVMAPARCSG